MTELPKGFKLFRLMGEYYVVDAKGGSFRCSPNKKTAIRYALQGVRPSSNIKF